ncbi:uncharacterized protein LOC110843018 [Folsomia candida]|uniref:uncharacterized protein LOC110843018 n=1 Tax=Folsomia candida TaxID=158441 RepID=UPI000B8FE69D|nr:uncharacterized protein LOC110843018 [Folsomia candida]
MTHYQLSVFVVASVFAITSVAEENIYCNRSCVEEFHNRTNPEFQECLDAQADCGMSAFAIAINVFIGLLTLVGIVAIGIRCCLLAKLIGNSKKEKPGYEVGDEVQQQLQPQI